MAHTRAGNGGWIRCGHHDWPSAHLATGPDLLQAGGQVQSLSPRIEQPYVVRCQPYTYKSPLGGCIMKPGSLAVSPIGDHVVTCCQRKLSKRLTGAFTLSWRKFEKITRQRRNSQAIVHTPQAARLPRFLHHRRVDQTKLPLTHRPQIQATLAKQCHAQRVKPVLAHLRSRFSNATSDSSANCAWRARTTVSRSEYPHARCTMRILSNFPGALSRRNPFNALVFLANSFHCGGKKDISTLQSSSIIVGLPSILLTCCGSPEQKMHYVKQTS